MATSFWKLYSEEDVQRAIRFYEQSPDGQYDEIAAAALRLVLEIRQLDMQARG